MKEWIRSLSRRRSRVYIFPTRMGGYLNGLIFLMFLLAVGYANNLLLIFTLFLLSFNMIWLIQTHFHLARLKFDDIALRSGHVNENLQLIVRWKKSPLPPLNWDLVLESSRGDIKVKALEESDECSIGEMKLQGRGEWNWRHLKVSTDLPFGLYRSWIFFPIQQQTFAYPELLKDTSLGVLNQTHLEGLIPQERKGHEDIRDLSPYRGEEARKISWKHYARTDELLVKEGTEWNDVHLHIKVLLPESPIAKEQYLKFVATQLVSAHRQQIPSTVEWGGKKFGPSSQEKHLHDCLKELSLC